MEKDNNKNKYEIVDFFANIAGGNKKLNTRIPRLEVVKPPVIEHKELQQTEKIEIDFPTFDEELEYRKFLKEKEELKKHYLPFLKNYAKSGFSPVKNKPIVDFQYRRETEADSQDFFSVLSGAGQWENIKIPHYVGPEGIYNSFYRTRIVLDKKESDCEYLIDFEAVDYIAEVYLNGRLITSHTGFFAPFSAVLTPYIKQGVNTLLVVVKNDIPARGTNFNGLTHYGNKVYGATHLGYDEPYLGWHHCPAGAGIFGKVTFVCCKKQRITDIYVRPDTDNSKITVNTTFYNFLHDATDCKVKYTIQGRNFNQTIIENFEGKIKKVLIEENYLEEQFDLPQFKWWTIEQPYLYQITVTLTDANDNVLDEKQTHFGMRKFFMDENSQPKGKFYLNNERIILRGANEMGHLPRCVMENNYEQLIDDILIAKVAGLNFFRLTQRPVLSDIYTYFDMLGMMCQSDFPCFLFLRESIVGEAFKQVDEMEHLTRNHPSVIIESFCNETADSEDYGWEQYGLGRERMQRFFDGARQTVLMSNLDRVVKYCDGDYSPLKESYGVSDFHCYTYWYVSHGIASGKFEKGYLPPFRQDWMTGCGEYGTDGLDRLELMKKYFPKEWLPDNDEQPWTPKRIAKAQCFGSHKQFFPEQNNICDWIRESREWQRKAIKKYVHCLRRRVDYVQSTAVHLLIDAWPSGWTKTLVDVERIPKPAYYAFKEANIPVRVSLRKDKQTVYNNDKLITEIYALNDTAKDKNVKVYASVYFDGELQSTYFADNYARAVSSTYLGDVVVDIKGFSGKITVVAKMISDGVETFDVVDFESKPQNKKAPFKPIVYGEKLTDILNLCEGETNENIIFCDNVEFRNRQDELEEKVYNGARVVVFTNRPINVLDENIIFKVHNIEEELSSTKNMVYINQDNDFVKEFSSRAFDNIYNKNIDCKDLIAWFHFDWPNSEEILYDLEDTSKDVKVLNKTHKMVMALKKHGKGELILSTLSALNGCIGHNPDYDKLFINLIKKDI